MWDKGSIFEDMIIWVSLYVVSCTASKDFSVCYTFKKGMGKGEYFLASVGKKDDLQVPSTTVDSKFSQHVFKN